MTPSWTRTIEIFARKYSPEILSGLAVAGVIGTAILAVKATAEAIPKIRELEQPPDLGEGSIPVPASNQQKIELCWKLFIPAALSAAGTIACIAGASRIGTRRNAALVAGMALADRAFQEYKDEVGELLSRQKQDLVQEKIAQKEIDAAPAPSREVLVIGNGDQLCFDRLTARYFRGDIEVIRRSENEINRRTIADMYASLNEFYTLIGLPDCEIGEELGWNVEHFLKVIFTSHLRPDDGTPCLAIGYEKLPIAKYGQVF